jgi:voltage-gated potassium channel
MTLASFKRATYYALNSDRSDKVSEKVIHLIITALIGLCLVTIVLKSEKRFYDQYSSILDFSESVILIIFATEYILRMWSATINPKYKRAFWGRLKFAFTFLALADLVAVLPLVAPNLVPVDLTFVRSARLLAILGIVNIGRHSHAMELLLRSIKSKRHEIAASFIIIGILILCASIVMYHIEGPKPPFNSVPASFWWSIAMVTTVDGYSNIFPITMAGKFCAIVISFLGLTALAFPSSIIVTGLLEQSPKLRRLCSKCRSELEPQEAS